MRRVMELLEEAPERRLSRVELERELVEREGYRSDNVLRCLRALRRMYLVGFMDRRFKATSSVALPEKPKQLGDHEVFELLKRLEDKR